MNATERLEATKFSIYHEVSFVICFLNNFFPLVIYTTYIGLYIFLSALLFACVSKCNVLVNPIAEHKPVEILETLVWPNVQKRIFSLLTWQILHLFYLYIFLFLACYVVDLKHERKKVCVCVCVGVCMCVEFRSFSFERGKTLIHTSNKLSLSAMICNLP
jgi:hypothetical protein